MDTAAVALIGAIIGFLAGFWVARSQQRSAITTSEQVAHSRLLEQQAAWENASNQRERELVASHTAELAQVRELEATARAEKARAQAAAENLQEENARLREQADRDVAIREQVADARAKAEQLEKANTELREKSERDQAERKESSKKEHDAREEAARATEAVSRLKKENEGLREQAKRDQDVLKTLRPVEMKLKEVHDQVARLERERAEQYGKLTSQLRSAEETDKQLREQTQALVGAMRTTSARGQWGEIELRRVIEVSGMLPRVDFEVQATVQPSGVNNQTVRPDVVVHLPGEKHLVIDAKVPLSSFLEASEISDRGTVGEQQQRDDLLKKHAKALRGHVDILSSRKYWDTLSVTPEFTVLFLPSENLLGEALRADPSLLEHAFTKNIALATPSTLLALLKTIATIWQQSVVTDQARALLNLGKDLYDRLGALGVHTAKLGRSLGSAVADYNKMVGTMESRVLVTARKFPGFDEGRLGSLDEISQEKAQVRKLTRHEFTEQPVAEITNQPADGA
jgi:DNA recombination protein RmuC